MVIEEVKGRWNRRQTPQMSIIIRKEAVGEGWLEWKGGCGRYRTQCRRVPASFPPLLHVPDPTTPSSHGGRCL